MSDFSSQQQWKRGGNPASRAATANLIPYRPGQSGNPGGKARGTPSLSHAYARMLRLTPEKRKCYTPQDGAEEIALSQIKEAIDGEVRAAKEIADRLEGKALQRVADANADEVSRQARALFDMLARVRDSFAQALSVALEAIPVSDAAREPIAQLRESITVPDDVLISAVVGAFDDGQVDIVMRTLEGIE